MTDARASIETIGTITGRTCGGAYTSTLERCTRPAVAYLVVGCIHEHIMRGYLCDQHRTEALDGQMLCPPCWLSPDQHRCPALAREVPHAH